jgi:hypothetical protein
MSAASVALAWSAAPGGGGATLDPGSLVPLIFGGGGALAMALLILVLLLTGRLHTDPEFKRLETALDKSEAAGAEKDRTIGVLSARADAGIQGLQVIASAFASQERKPGGGT